ncbi:MAG: [protein-PII] uridylyltransferase [Hydrogenothermaceae bacterium]|nr:[protein-PII] uridylyltransferase [Hydrogenothermaceae bacterium]
MKVLNIDKKKEILDNYFTEKKKLIQEHYDGKDALSIVKDLSDLTDKTIVEFANLSFDDPESITIIVLGGYGRRELCFRSDIDISLVYSSDNIERLKTGIETFYYLLLDLKVDIGFSPRNIKMFLNLSREDLTVATALLQGRFLYGNEDIYNELIGKFKKLIKAKRKQYVEATLKSRKVRYQNTGSSIYMMEPHLKEGEGGLRDFHEVYWIAKVLDDVPNYRYFVSKNIILEEEYIELLNGYSFLLRIRNQMHLICNKKCDVLTFPLQEEVAKKLGFVKDPQDVESLRESVEQMMKQYYQSAKSINNITKRILKNLTEDYGYEEFIPIDDIFIRTSSELDVLNYQKFESNPVNILKAFVYYKDYGLDFSSKLEFLLRKNQSVFKRLDFSPEIKALVRRIFSSIKNLSKTLKRMQDFYVLDDIIPEFGFQRCHFQYDHYHKYTTDAHAIKAIEELEKLYKLDHPHKKQIYQIYKDIERKDLLIWAMFLHDIGKGHKSDHSLLGSKMVWDIMLRFDYPKADVEIVSFLVRHHLAMAHISQRRNLNDPKVIEDFIQTIKNPQLLKMLTVLTWCDANGVGPNLWNDWKQTLLLELYDKSTEVFEQNISLQELFEKKLIEKKEKLIIYLTELFGEERVSFHMKRISDYYITSTPVEDIIEHLKLEEELLNSNKKFVYKFEKNVGAGYSHIVLAVRYIENPLLVITCILAYLNINILTVYSFNRTDDIILIDLQVSTSALEAIDESKFYNFVDTLKEYLQGKVDIETLSKKRVKGFKSSTIPPPVFVKVDNEMSDSYTIFDISGEDRVGLLFDIVNAFSEFDIYVHIAKVSTQGIRARDAFYVRTKDKRKITDINMLEKVKERLLRVITS